MSRTNLFDSNNTSANNWIQDSVDQIFKNGTACVGNGLIPFFANEIDVGIDTSGSTFNQHSGGRGGRSGYDNSYKSEESGTDPIIVAEIKGVIYYLLEVSKLYNLEGVTLKIYEFSSGLYESESVKLTDNQSLDPVLRNLSKKLKLESGQTNLMSYLQKVLDDREIRKVHMIVATDGRPNIGGNVSDILSYLKSIPENVYNQLTMTVIGAGSIQSASGGSRGVTCRCETNNGSTTRRTLYQVDDSPSEMDLSSLQLLLFGSKPNTNSECNIGFLLEMMNLLKKSIYLPAFGDYSKLIEVANKYLTSGEISGDMFSGDMFGSSVLNYKVVLDGGNQVDVPSLVNDNLKKYNSVIGYCLPVRSWYLYTRQWQVAIDLTSQLVNTDQIYTNRTTLNLEHYSDYYSARIGREIGPFRTVDRENLEFKILVDGNGYWRCRQILQS